MVPEDIPILHPASYDLRNYVVQLINRSVAAGDTAQRGAISNLFIQTEAVRIAAETLHPADMLQDTVGHYGRHLKWLLSELLYKSLFNADINTDLENIAAVVLGNTGWLNFKDGFSFSNQLPGDTAWTNPQDAQLEDGVNAISIITVLPGVSQYLQGIDLNAPIPTGNTINGIEIRFKTFTSSGIPLVNRVQLVKGGIISGNNNAGNEPIPAVLQYLVYGSPTDLWGLTLADTDINSANFGFALGVSASGTFTATFVDHMQMKIYHS